MDESLVERVLVAVELIPAGRVASYGDIAGLLGIGPRQVGAIMRHHGAGVPWWRVTSHAGDLPAPLLRRAADRWAEEGITVKPNGLGCRINQYRLDLVAWADAWDRAIAAQEKPGNPS
ncbi:MAG TPA: MGMT family protein [Candidatus Avipropionibacterium avicola]|uniref:MGMT family protein n=1 Tax=Candidatus Avipropionibacterium avicola TaxID=2840701 RepID=A0A9D1GYA7_9ACTN|nr:MGMT family protein [Candidatus Avipropionibacterium avicola]